MSSIPGQSCRVDYIMMRLPRLCDMEETADHNEPESPVDLSKGLHPGLMSALSRSEAPTSRKRNESMKSTSTLINNLRMSVKVNLRSPESKLALKALSLMKKRSADCAQPENKGLDMEESKQRKIIADNMTKTRQEDQAKHLASIQARFNPLSIL